MENVYIYFDDSTKVLQDKVIVSDVATVCCQDNTLRAKINALKIYSFKNAKEKNNKSNSRVIITALKIFDIILKEYPDITLIPLGSTDIIIEKNVKQPAKSYELLKVTIICLITFFGSAFTIMAFNNDVQVHKVFTQIYEFITGKESDGFTLLEFFYCLGLGIGIIVFYNHFGRKKLSLDPTPLEIEMRLYETDINNTLIDGVKRKKEHIDVE